MDKHTVLIPLDGSPFSHRIVPHICELFAPQSYALILLRVAEPVEGVYGAPPNVVSSGWTRPLYESARDLEYANHPIYTWQAEESERAALERELLDDRLALARAGYEVSAKVSFGDPAQEIIRFAEEQAVDLVAMATHGHSGFQHLVLGSVAEQVMQKLALPVLLMRPFLRAEQHRKQLRSRK